MADFFQYIPKLLKIEGGFVDNPDDFGGPTNMGITFKTFKRYARKLLNIAHTLENLKRLTPNQATRIYKVGFWDTVRGDQIRNQHIAEIVADAKINQTSFAVKLLQKMLNKLGNNLKVDGVFGSKTLRAVNRASVVKLHTLYKEGREFLYRQRAKNVKNQMQFLEGWLERLTHFPDLSMDLRQKKNYLAVYYCRL